MACFSIDLANIVPCETHKNTRSAHNSSGNTKLTLRRRFDTPKNRCHSLRPARLIKKHTKTLSTTKLTGEAHATHPNRCNSTRVPLRRTRAQPRNRNRDDRQVNAHNKHAKCALQNRRHTIHMRAKNESAICFHNTHNMCKLTLTRSKLRPDSRIARQSTYRAGEDRCRQTYRKLHKRASDDV